MQNADDDTTPKVSENTETTAEKHPKGQSPQGGNAIRQARIREQFSKKQ